MRRHRVFRFLLTACALAGMLLVACSGASTKADDPGVGPADIVEEAEPEEEVEEPTEDVGPKVYNVPADDANVVNPIPADDASVQRGEEIYRASCIECHGEEGRGDGPAGLRQNPLPADFRAEYVKELSDGELFYIITNGTEGSAMIAWGFFDEEQRWHLVNFIRTLQE